jgi:hypothetical protein
MMLLARAFIGLSISLSALFACAQSSQGSQGTQERWLVTQLEATQFEGEAGYLVQPSLRARAVLPLIEIIQPELDHEGKLRSPFALNIAFRARADAAIDPSTFRVFYGASQFDITSRLIQWSPITADGLQIVDLNLPKGRHLIALQVIDANGKVAARELRLEVE